MWHVDGSTRPASAPFRGWAASFGRRRPIAVLATAAGAFVAGTMGTARESAAQSPFTQPPSRSGDFGIPRAGPERRTPGTAPRPTSPRPAAGGAALPTLPAEELPRRPSELRPFEVPSIPALPTAPTGEAVAPLRPLPPKPEVAPPLEAASTEPVSRIEPTILKAGTVVTIRVSQVLPKDGLTSGERLLNSKPAIVPGDCFLAEVVEPRQPYPVLVGGTVTGVDPPGRFGRPGHVSIRMTQLVQTSKEQSGVIPWRMDMVDRRFTTKMRRVLLTTLLGLEGVGTGASIGAQFSSGNMAFIGAGMGIGALVGFGYATLQRGVEAILEPGDTFEIRVGTTQYRPVSREWQTILYPAADAGAGKRKHP